MTVEESLGIKKPATEETLQSIEATLKRIENILLDQTRPTSVSIEIPDRNTDDLVNEHT